MTKWKRQKVKQKIIFDFKSKSKNKNDVPEVWRLHSTTRQSQSFAIDTSFFEVHLKMNDLETKQFLSFEFSLEHIFSSIVFCK